MAKDDATLSPDEFAYFRNSRRRIIQNNLLNKQQNQYQRDVLGENYGMSRSNAIDQFNRFRRQLPGSFINRGLINSGLYQRGLADYQTDRTKQLGNMDRQYQSQLSGLNLADTQLDYTKDQSLKDLYLTKRQRLASILAQGGY